MPARISLIGSRGCGKTTIGGLVAEALGWRFLDLDAEIERLQGRTITALFAQVGEPAFRELESAALAQALAVDLPQVLSTGGGCVLHAENRARLRAHGGRVVFLDTPVPVLQARLRQDRPTRPSLTGASVSDEVAAVLRVREPLYRQVATDVIAGDLPLASIVDEILRLVDNVTKSPRGLQKHPMA
jgi:shikimate kinase